MFMTKNVLKNLFSKSATRLYPAEVRAPFKGFRGMLENAIDVCIFCKKCQLACPSQCLKVDLKARTWECDPFACVYCGVCVDVCPVASLSMRDAYRPVTGEREMIFMQGAPKAVKEKKEKKEKDEA
ncbi:MAG: 4Fe-4S binding protein [Desulfovibrionaceae bacterium]|nr:4Fe-4S binding protein [Desulfovibrionaceae bacterium]MBF0514939.1 4Fe-4S binding protein [Desulfovibrionaceae bacterium]